jgi:Flp pilus assembly CpaE family ATPase
LGSSSSLLNAIAKADDLDEDLWPQLIGKCGKLDVLHAGKHNPPASVDLPGLHGVLASARAQYDVICADLASRLDPFSIDLMRASRRIFLVTTAEVLPLHLAKERVGRLTELGLSERVSLLLNRKTSGGGTLSEAEVAEAVGIPVTYSFSNDFAGVQDSIRSASPIAQESDLGQSILNLANSLAPHLAPKETSTHRKFLEFFHLPHRASAPEVLV